MLLDKTLLVRTMELRDVQLEAAEFILRNRTTFLMADVGRGKTATALTAIKKSRHPAIIFAPINPCFTTWPDEIKKWTPTMSYTVLHGTRKNQRLQFRRDAFIIPYSSLKWFYTACVQKKFKMRRSFLVLDESSFVKNASTQRFKMLSKMFALFPDYRLCLSATPATNGYVNLWSQVYMLDKGKRLGGSFYSFRNKYFIYTGPPMYKTYEKDDTREKITKAIAPITFRIENTTGGGQPEVISNEIKVTLPKEARSKYQELEKDFCMDILNGTITAMNAAVLSAKLRQIVQVAIYDQDGGTHFVHNAKVDALKDMVEGAAGNPILCPIQYRFEHDIIRKRIDKDVPLIVGKTPQSKATHYIREWNKGRLPLLLCHPASLGHGVNLQTGGHTLLWYALPWSLEQYIQMNGRLARHGQEHSVIINHLIMEDTIDHRVLKVLREHETTQQTLLDALRDYAKERMA